MGLFYQPPIIGEKQYTVEIVRDSFPSHWHSEVEFLYCINGSFNVIYDHNLYEVSKDEAVFISSVSEHELIMINPGSIALVVEIGYYLLGNDFKILAERCFTESVVKFNDEISTAENAGKTIGLKRIKELFLKLYNKTSDTGYWNNWIVKSCLYEISALTAQYIPMTLNSSDKRAKKLDKITKVQPVLDYVTHKYQHNITIEEAASLINYEKKSFCRIFKSTTGMTFHNYLNLYRINTAKALLACGQYSVKEVGSFCGISCSKSFNRLFKQYVNLTPGEYKIMNYNK